MKKGALKRSALLTSVLGGAMPELYDASEREEFRFLARSKERCGQSAHERRGDDAGG
jgi:hypothetical protein